MTEGTEEPEPMEQGEEIEAPEEAILNNVPILKMIKGEYSVRFCIYRHI